MFLGNLSLMFSAGMAFCIGLNLLLVLAFSLNGQRMEKYYITGTALIISVCNIVPYAFGQFGWNTDAEMCWYRSTDPASRLRWFIGTQTVWLLLASFGEVVAFLITSFLRAMRELHPGSKTWSDSNSSTQGAAPCFSTFLELPLTNVESESGKDDMLESLELGQTTKGNGGTPEVGGEEEWAGLPVHPLNSAMHSPDAFVKNNIACHL
ncbi:hypothetical protein B0H13DRAFT_1996512 [Mycena leptocephala]|nr:hypothetical protein B0H13DRAFT_1996512 [Mycena leptocephala]